MANNKSRPRESRRQLEQRSEELPCGESELQFAGQPEQQPWLPPCFFLAQGEMDIIIEPRCHPVLFQQEETNA